MEVSWLLTIIILLSLSYFVLKLLIAPLDKVRLPPGPSKLPIIGNLHQLAAKNTPIHHLLQQLARVHGPIMHLRLGEVHTVVVSSAEVAKEVMKTHDANFASRPKLIVGKVVYYDYSDIGLAPYGEYWRQVRKIAALELFTANRVKSSLPIREEEVTNFINSIALEAVLGSVINPVTKFSAYILTSHLVVFNRKGKDQEAFRKFVIDLTEVLSGFSIADVYPSIKILHSIGGMRKKLQEMIKQSDKLLDPIIDDHKSNKKKGIAEGDLVDVLLKFHMDNPHETGFYLTTNNIKGIILEIFAAGSETSSSTVEWAMSELLKHPKVMEKAQAEVRKVYQGKTIFEETSLHELKLLKSVVKETLRLHPPAPLLLPRESIEPCKIQGYDIPSKTRVLVNAYAIGRDPAHWAEPNKFKPERFEGSTVDFKGNNFELIPFGAGRRMCPGMTLGLANVELPLAMLLYHFDWKFPLGIKPEDLNMDESVGVTARRKNDLHVIPILHTSSPLLK